MTIEVFGVQMNLMGLVIGLIFLGILFLFYRVQKSNKLDFTDLITKDGISVSLTKVLQLIGGICATWVIITLTLTGEITEGIFGLYLAYVGAIEGYSKFISAKYGYKALSLKSANALAVDEGDPSSKLSKD